MVLKDVLYGVSFHFELTGLKSERETDPEKKYYNILKRRLEKGQYFRIPCLGCSEFPVKSVTLVDGRRGFGLYELQGLLSGQGHSHKRRLGAPRFLRCGHDNILPPAHGKRRD